MVKFNFYPIDIQYKVVNDKALIYMYGRDDKGKQVCVVDSKFEPYLLVMPSKKADINNVMKRLEKLEGEDFKVTKVKIIKKKFYEQEVELIKVFADLPVSVPKLRDEITHSDGVEEVFEFDIPFVRRYLIDNDIVPLNIYKVEAEPLVQKSRVEVFEAKKIEQGNAEPLTNPRILAFDIETYNPDGKGIDPEKNPIIMVSFYGKNFKKVITWKKAKNADVVESESELIERFKEVISDYKPDILCGYYSDGFDFPYLLARAKKYKIKLDLALDFSELKKGRGMDSSISMVGIAHVDVLKFVRNVLRTALKTQTYELDSVAFELLGEKKKDVDIENLAKVWDSGKGLEDFCDYNLQDSKITYELCVKLFPNMMELIKLIGLPLVDINRMGLSQLVEWYLMKRANEFNQLAPNRPKFKAVEARKGESFEGAFVYEPTAGLYHNIAIFDFRSLYPTIIASHNISGGTLNCDCCKDTERAPVDKKDYYFCKKKKGFVPSAIKDLIERRIRVKEIMKADKKDNALLHARQIGLKLLANSFYGYLGFFGARWYSIESAMSVTAYARHYITTIIDDAKSEGFNVIYSDTDSVFLTLDSKSEKEAKEFVAKANKDLPELMELEYEGFYPAGIFVSAKASETGAKKKYALLSEDDEVIIKGFETVRRNWSLVAKDLQKYVLERILKGEHAEKVVKHVKEVIDDLRKNKISLEKVKLSTQLTKDIDSYENISPHVFIAQRMKSKGMPVGPGTIIEYIICKGKGKIRDKAKMISECSENDYDPEYYINNQIIPAIARIFEVLGYKEEDLLNEGDQKKLDSF